MINNTKNGTDTCISNCIDVERSNINPESVPLELKNRKHWVLWKLVQTEDGLKKIPYPRGGLPADPGDPGTWSNFDQIFTVYQQSNKYGIGYMFSESDPYVGIDCDDCIDESGITSPEISEIIKLSNTYTEISPRGKGYHIICKGTKPGTECGSKKIHFEMYEKRRFFTFTGNHMLGTPFEINEAPEAIKAVYDKILASKPKSNKQDQLIDEAIVKIFKKLGTKKAQKLKKLFNGDTGGYKSPSEADFAFCCLLAPYIRDPEQIYRIVQKSGLYDKKWERDDYKRDTIGKALERVDEKKIVSNELEEVKIRRPYIITEDRVYLSVIDKKGKLYFAWFENHQLNYAESVTINEDTIYTQVLPADAEKSRLMIGIPAKEELDIAGDVSAIELFNIIYRHLQTYLDAPDIEIEMFTYFILFTWFYKKGNTVPYIRFIGDTGTGKSRFLTILSNLCFYPITVEGSSSSSAIIRLNEQWHGSLKIDESDLRGDEASEIIKFLNLGFEANHPFLKTNKNDFNKFDTFDPFGPKLIAMRKPFQDNATEARCLSHKTRQMTRNDIAINLPDNYQDEVAKLRALIARFVMLNWNKVSSKNCINYVHLDLEPRLRQLAYPLSIIFQLLPDGKSMFEEYMRKRQAEVTKTRSNSFEGFLFNRVLALATNEESLPEEYSEYCVNGEIIGLTPAMVARVFGATATTVTRTLQGIGFEVESVSVKVAGKSKTIKKYTLPDKQAWYDVYSRYHSVELDGKTELECPKALRSRTFV